MADGKYQEVPFFVSLYAWQYYIHILTNKGKEKLTNKGVSVSDDKTNQKHMHA